jgi:hypothetical protein
LFKLELVALTFPALPAASHLWLAAKLVASQGFAKKIKSSATRIFPLSQNQHA